MKRKIYIAFIGMSLTLLVHSSAYAQQPRPTPIGRPVSGKPAVPLAQSSNSSKQEGRTQTSTPPKVKLAPASLSIKEIKEPVNESNIKVLVQNTGDLPSKGGAAKVTIDLLKEVNGSNSPMYFWVDVGKVLGKGLPMSVMTAFTKTVPIPTIAPGKSVWISVGFVLPDPGTYADRPYSPMPFASLADVCASLKSFFASHPRIKVRIENTGAPAVLAMEQQLSPSYFKFMDMPPGKYEGQCK